MSCSLTTQDGGSGKDGVGVGSRHQSCALTWSRREQGSNPGPNRGGGPVGRAVRGEGCKLGGTRVLLLAGGAITGGGSRAQPVPEDEPGGTQGIRARGWSGWGSSLCEVAASRGDSASSHLGVGAGSGAPGAGPACSARGGGGGRRGPEGGRRASDSVLARAGGGAAAAGAEPRCDGWRAPCCACCWRRRSPRPPRQLRQ